MNAAKTLLKFTLPKAYRATAEEMSKWDPRMMPAPLDIGALGLIINAGLYLVCKETLPVKADVPPVPLTVETDHFAHWNHLEVTENACDVTVMLYEGAEERVRQLKYETHVTKDAWYNQPKSEERVHWEKIGERTYLEAAAEMIAADRKKYGVSLDKPVCAIL